METKLSVQNHDVAMGPHAFEVRPAEHSSKLVPAGLGTLLIIGIIITTNWRAPILVLIILAGICGWRLHG
ncbi:hypothetical protein HFO24_03000 [Rhizobium laguerreae]|uniref:hypothetical protein n=1 Tax=Rhizobium laguerreae TaxID=1076926 RepID=UPI001C909CD2|nr:hypothetical protein [Rhizobium laguerreae]MBY3180647.1 hypothetical protein [Rhizobium laguerreae]